MNDERARIDPQGRYQTSGLTRVEEHALKLLDLLPGATIERTRDSVQLDFQGEQGIVVILTPEALEIRLPTIEWTGGAYSPAASSKLWKRLRWNTVLENDLASLIASALAARKKQFSLCKYCGQEYAPEHRVRRNVCHGCASQYEGIVL